MDSARIAFLGTGVMGSALARCMVSSGAVAARDLVLFDVDSQKMLALAEELGAAGSVSASEALGAASVAFLCAKPVAIPAMVREISPVAAGRLLISIAAGVTLQQLADAAQGDIAFARMMPNTPAQVGAGASAISFNASVTDPQRADALELLSATGLVVEVPEPLMNAVTGLSGSGPAYVFTFIEALADAGVANGIPRPAAVRLAAQTVLGAAKMVLETGRHPAELRDQVTTPGGTTAAGSAELEAAGFRNAVARAVTAAARKAGELAK